MMKIHKPGFTIIELMIATAVFSTILLIALAGFTGIGSLFYKGVAVNQTQDVATQIMDDLRANIQAAPSISSGSDNGYTYYCVGGTRYTYTLNHILTGSEDWSQASPNFALIKDSLPASGACSAPCTSGCTAPFLNAQEIMANNMQLVQFSIAPSSYGGHLYEVNVTIAYGDESAFANAGDPQQMTCQGGLSGQRFCAVIRTSSSVYEGLHS